ncbi:MAG TPA: hypothetical protein VM658_18720 [bacterium]|nr:hypothetical protein [bacterium]
MLRPDPIFAEEPLDLRFEGRVKMTLTTDEGTVVKEGPAHGMIAMAG